MNYADARRIASQSGAPEDGDLYNAIGGAASDMAAAESSLRDAIRSLRGNLDSVEQQLDRPDRQPLLNDLGELQGRGPAFDVSVAKFCARQHELQTLLHLASRLHPAPAAE
jgi:hypothetical protein